MLCLVVFMLMRSLNLVITENKTTRTLSVLSSGFLVSVQLEDYV